MEKKIFLCRIFYILIEIIRLKIGKNTTKQIIFLARNR